MAAGAAELEEELGDLMFALVNVVRKQGFDPEKVMRQANQKFERRFRQVEQALVDQGSSPAQSTLDEMELLWLEVKKLEKQNKLKGYKIPKLKFSLELEEEIMKYLIRIHGGKINEKNTNTDAFWNTS